MTFKNILYFLIKPSKGCKKKILVKAVTAQMAFFGYRYQPIFLAAMNTKYRKISINK